MKQKTFGNSVLVLAVLVCSGQVQARAGLYEDALRATVRIASGGESGTGFFVVVGGDGATAERHLLVTAAHVFDNMKADKCTVIFRAPRPEGGFVRKEVALTIREGGKPLWLSPPEVDVAVIPLVPPKDVDLRAFAYEQVGPASLAESGKVHVGLEVCIPCFPAKTEANPAGWPILRKGSIATHPLTPLTEAKTMFVDYSHFGGDSGAPVVALIGDQALVVGLVTAMQRQTDTVKTPFEERTVFTPLDLALAVQSPFVRQTIDQWKERK